MYFTTSAGAVEQESVGEIDYTISTTDKNLKLEISQTDILKSVRFLMTTCVEADKAESSKNLAGIFI